MRLLAAVLLTLHGIAHLVGFRSAFWPALVVPGRGTLLGGRLRLGSVGDRALGVLWLILTLGYVLAAGLLLLHSPGWADVTLGVTSTSALMCLMFLPEARIGLAIDMVLFAVVLALSRPDGAYLAGAFTR